MKLYTSIVTTILLFVGLGVSAQSTQKKEVIEKKEVRVKSKATLKQSQSKKPVSSKKRVVQKAHIQKRNVTPIRKEGDQ